MPNPEAKFTIKATNKSGPVLARFKRGMDAMNKSIFGVKGGLAALAGAGGFGLIVKATAEQELAMNKLNAVLRSTKGAAGATAFELIKNAEALQGVTTFGDEAIIKMQSMLLTFTNLKRDILPDTTEAVLNLSTAMGQDLKSSAIQLGKALNDPITGISALTRSGIQFSEDQKKVIKSMVDSGRTADAQRLILSELETQFGGAARAARDTFGGSLIGLKNAFGDLLEGSGGLTTAKLDIESLTTLLQDPKTKEAADKLISSLISGFSTLVGLVPPVVNFIEDIGEGVAQFFHGSADPIERMNSKIIEASDNLNDLNEQLHRTSNSRSMSAQRTASIREDISATEDKLKQYVEIREQLMKDIETTATTMPLNEMTVSPGITIDATANQFEERRRAEGEIILAMENELWGKINAVRDQKQQEWLRLQEGYADIEISLRQNVTAQTIGLLSALGKKSKVFAVAAIAVEKATAIQRVLIQSQVAAMAALTPPPIGLGPVAGAGLAAKIALAGKLSAGLIAATGAVQIANLNEGGAALGSSSNPINTTGSEDTFSATSQPAPAPPQITFIVAGGGSFDIDEIIDQAAHAITFGSRMLIQKGTPQMETIINAVKSS